MATQPFHSYQLIRLLGRSEVAEVYEASRSGDETRLALKWLFPGQSPGPAFADYFRQEMARVAALRHPHTVPLVDFGVEHDQAFLVTPYLEGGSLEDVILHYRNNGHPVPLAEIARLLPPLAAALDAAHAQGVVHLNLTPANILLDEANQPAITDFGVAGLLSHPAAAHLTRRLPGNPIYMSPEQARGEPAGPASDIYSLSVILYEMATGWPPFRADSPMALLRQHASAQPPSPMALNPELQPALEGVLRRGLAKTPEERFQSAGELADAFQAALVDKPAPEPVPAPETRSQPEVESGQEDRHLDWLAGLLFILQFVAPLAGKHIDNLDTPQDRRARLLAVMSAFGILMVALRTVVSVYGILARPISRMMQASSYIIQAIFLLMAILLILMIVKAPSRRRRAQAVVFFFLMVLAGLAWGGWTAYGRLKPPEGMIVAVADFDGSQASRHIDFARRIGEELIRDLRDVGDVARVVRTLRVAHNPQEARKQGEKDKATLVIWGWYDDAGVNPRVELLRPPELHPQPTNIALVVNAINPLAAKKVEAAELTHPAGLAQYVRQPIASTDVDLFARDGPQQMTYVVSAILGIGFYGEGDSERALSMFDRALASAQEGGDAILGEERVYFHRAMALYDLGRLDEAEADLKRAIALQPDLFEAHYNLAMLEAVTCGAGNLDLDDAIAEAETAARLRPTDVNAYRLLGDLYRQAGQAEKAVTALEKAVALTPQDALAYELLSVAYADLGREEEAATAAQQAVSLSQAAAEAHDADPFSSQMAMGDAYMQAGQYEQALATYQKAQAIAPDDASAHTGVANALYWLGEKEQALAAYEAAAKLDPSNANNYVLAGLVAVELGQTSQAKSYLQQAASLASCDPAPHLILGELYWREEAYDQAAKAYEDALALDPTNADAWYLLGTIRYLFLQDYPAAIEAESKAIALHPDMPEALWVLGAIALDQKDYATAADILARYTELNPTYALGYVSLGDAYAGLGRWEDAAKAYQEALDISPDATAYISLGLALHRLGRLDQAADAFESALKLDPTIAAARQALGDIAFQQGQWEEAASEYNKALSLDENAEAHANLAQIDVNLGRLDDAISHLKRAIELDPDQWMYPYRLGVLYAQQGRLPEAEAQYRAALALDDSRAEVHYALGQIAYQQCNLSGAVQSAKQAASLQSDYRGWLAAMYAAQGREDDAATLYADLKKAPPEDIFAHLSVGDHLMRREQWDEAARTYENVLDQPDLAPGVASVAHAALGKVYMQQERFQAAQAEFEQALALWPANADAQSALGELALRQGDAAAALSAYEKAWALLPQFELTLPPGNATLVRVSVQVGRGLALARLGRVDAAHEAFDAALALSQTDLKKNPRSPPGHLALAVTHLARGDGEGAEAAAALAIQCDESLRSTWQQIKAVVEMVKSP